MRYSAFTFNMLYQGVYLLKTYYGFSELQTSKLLILLSAALV